MNVTKMREVNVNVHVYYIHIKLMQFQRKKLSSLEWIRAGALIYGSSLGPCCVLTSKLRRFQIKSLPNSLKDGGKGLLKGFPQYKLALLLERQ